MFYGTDSILWNILCIQTYSLILKSTASYFQKPTIMEVDIKNLRTCFMDVNHVITLFRSIIVLCETDNISWNILHIEIEVDLKINVFYFKVVAHSHTI